MELEESHFLASYHATIEKEWQKSYHHRNIKKKHFNKDDQVLLYDSKFMNHPGKLQIHWINPFIVVEIKYYGVVKLTQLDGFLHLGWVKWCMPKALCFYLMILQEATTIIGSELVRS